MPNFATKGFWRYIRERYDGDQIVVDCKNYSAPLTKEQVLPVAHYITKKSCGLFALICSRSEITESAHNAIKHQWIHYDKMIICLTDEELIEMIGDKMNQLDPSKTIKKKIIEFRKRID